MQVVEIKPKAGRSVAPARGISFRQKQLRNRAWDFHKQAKNVFVLLLYANRMPVCKG
jgi:hypothetical protein